METRAELPFTGDQVGLFRAQPGPRPAARLEAWRKAQAAISVRTSVIKP